MVPPRFRSLVAWWATGASRQLRDLTSTPKPTIGDLVGGVSVALVIIPQSLAYADLAGLPPAMGLFAAAFPLLIFGAFASSPYLQTGPVALTSLLTGSALVAAGLEPRTSAYVAAAGVLAVIVAVVRLVVGVLGLGSVVYLMAEPVMIGFTSGAGLVILSSQLPKALGIVLPPHVAEWGSPILRAIWALGHPATWSGLAIGISVVTLVLMLWGRRVHRLFPGVLFAVVAALLFSRLTNYSGPVIPEIEAGLPKWQFDLPWASSRALIGGGVMIALVGFAEPASIARLFASEDHSRWSASREFVASGLANGVAGLTGAYPVGGSFSRSSINRFAGADTRLSGVVTGLVVIAFLPVASMLDRLPEAVLGAIVVGAVFNLVKPRKLARMWSRSPWQAGLAWLTFAATLLSPPNLQYAVLLGVVATIVVHVLRPFRLEVAQSPDGAAVLRPSGLLWLATMGRFRSELDAAILSAEGTDRIVLDLALCSTVDAATIDVILTGRDLAESNGQSFRVTNVVETAEPLLIRQGIAVK